MHEQNTAAGELRAAIGPRNYEDSIKWKAELRRRTHVARRVQLGCAVRICFELVQLHRDSRARQLSSGLQESPIHAQAPGHEWIPTPPDFRDYYELAEAACGEGDRAVAMRHDMNLLVCKVWVRRWRRVAWLIRLNELIEVVLLDEPDDPNDLAIHELFVRLLTADSWEESALRARGVAWDLAELRVRLARAAPPECPDLHFKLARYFSDWLWPRLERAFEARVRAEARSKGLRFLKAKASARWAERMFPVAADDSRALYRCIKQWGYPQAYPDGRVPAYQSWLRYLRQ